MLIKVHALTHLISSHHYTARYLQARRTQGYGNSTAKPKPHYLPSTYSPNLAHGDRATPTAPLHALVELEDL